MGLWSGLIHGASFVPPSVGKVTTHTMPRVPAKPHVAKSPVAPPPKPAAKPVDPDNPWRLSPMQRKVLDALVRSKGPRRTAARALGISEKTVEVHLQRLRDRMGVHTTNAAVAAWMRVTMYRDMEAQRAAAEASLIAKLRQL